MSTKKPSQGELRRAAKKLIRLQSQLQGLKDEQVKRDNSNKKQEVKPDR